MASNQGKLCRDLIGGSLRIKDLVALDHDANLCVADAKVKGDLKVKGDTVLNGCLTTEDPVVGLWCMKGNVTSPVVAPLMSLAQFHLGGTGVVRRNIDQGSLTGNIVSSGFLSWQCAGPNQYQLTDHIMEYNGTTKVLQTCLATPLLTLTLSEDGLTGDIPGFDVYAYAPTDICFQTPLGVAFHIDGFHMEKIPLL